MTEVKGEQIAKSGFWTKYQAEIVALITAGMIINFMDRMNLSIIMPTLMKHHGVSAAAAGVLLSLAGWAQAGSNIFSGFLADRFHPRRVLPAGVALWSAATFIASLSANVYYLGFTRLLLGAGESTMLPCGAKLTAELFKKDSQGKVIGTYFSGTKVGLTIGAPIAATVLALYGWRAVFIVTGLLSALWLIPWFLIYRPNKEVIPEVLSAPSVGEPAQPKVKSTSLLKYKEVWALALGQGVYLYVYYVFLSWLPGYLVLQRHMSILKTGFFAMIPFFLAIFVGIISGWLCDLWIRKKGNVTLARKTFIGVGFALSTFFIVAGAHIQTQGLAIFCIFMSMGMLGMVSPNINALPIDLAPRRLCSSVAGLQNVGGNIGGALAPVVTGILYGVTGNFQVALYITGGLALVGAFVHVLLIGKMEPCIGLREENL